MTATDRVFDPAAFRSEFPVLERVTYLNSGTEGPLPRRAVEAVRTRLADELTGGRAGQPFFEQTLALAGELRGRIAALLGAETEEIALTGSTTDGVNSVIAGIDWRRGDEILTSDEEHPGLLVPLALARERHGVRIRAVPFASLGPEAVSSETRLIACSHVSWVGGQVLDAPALAATGVPVLLDAAQSIGAVPVDVKALGCAYYAASGQKWLCGPEGSGYLYVDRERLGELWTAWGAYGSVAPGSPPLELVPAEGAKRLDHGFPAGVRSIWSLASLDVLEGAGPGLPAVQERAATLAARLAEGLAEAGLEVAARGRSTLVSWRADDPEGETGRLAGEGVAVRWIPVHGLVRASVGGWCTEDELDRVVALAASR